VGVFDFVKNAGAKIGIGKSTGEEAAEEAAETAAAAAESASKRNAARERMRAQADQKRTEEKAAVRSEARKSVELERYVRDMGLEPMLTDPDLIFPRQVLRIPQ
jgi:hypothetical protein